MPEYKDVIYYSIYSLGIIVTGIFSFLVWKATKKVRRLHKKVIIYLSL